MSFQRMAFSPADGLNNKVHYPSAPVSEEQARAQVQGISDQIKAYLNDTLTAQLESTQTGQSGAEHIGSAAIDHVAGETVHQQIADLKSQIDDVVSGSVSDGAIATAKLADRAVTKAKMHENALNWTLVADSGVLSTAGTFSIPSQAGKSEMMIQFRTADGGTAGSVYVAPLDASGVIIPASFRAYSYNPADFSVDYRLVTMASATSLTYGISRAESTGGQTNLKRVYVFVR